MLKSARNRKLLVLTLIALAVLFFWQYRKVAVPVIKIGVLHSLTGTMAQSEAPLVDAVRLAVEEVNRSGGVNGARVEMVVRDCRSDDAYCATQAQTLIEQDRVEALFGCWTSSCRKAVAPVAEKYRQLLFYPVQYEGLEHAPYIVYTGAAPNQQVIPMVSWALQNKGRRAYLVGSDYVFPRTANRIVRKLIEAKGGQLLAERYVPLGGRDLDEVVREIAALHPDFVVNTLNGDSNLYFFRALRKAGISAETIPVFSTSIAEPELAAIGPALVAGHYAAWNYFQSVGNADNQSFIARFRQRFGSERVLDDPMEASYIGVQLWANAMRIAGTRDISALRNILASQTLAAPEGIIAVDGATQHLWKQVRVGRARADGQFDIVWESGRSIAPSPYPLFIPRSELDAIAEGAR